MTLRRQLLVLGVGGILATSLLLTAASMWESQVFSEGARKEAGRAVDADLGHIATSTADMVQAQDQALRQQVDADLNVADYVLHNTGSVHLADAKVAWNAKNQFTKVVTVAMLPQLTVGGKWLGQNSNPNSPTPIVDDVTRMTGATVTLFQRMDAQGDLLRVATSVRAATGKRAVGTYIPAVNPDGKPNPVAATIRTGKTFRGNAFVVNAWYLADYEPLFDAKHAVIGAYYVGVKQESVPALRQAILNTRVGKNGSIFVLRGKGVDAGQYLISKNGAQDGENVWGAKDAHGQLVFQDMIRQALSLAPGQSATVRYLWRDQGTRPRWKIARLVYYAPWDWVIGVDAYEDDFRTLQAHLDAGRRRMLHALVTMGLVIALIAAVLVWGFAGHLAARLKRLAVVTDRIAGGEIDQPLHPDGKDEIGQLIRSLGHAVAYLKETAGAATQIAEGDLSVQIYVRSERDTLGRAFSGMVTTLQETTDAAARIAEGDLSRQIQPRSERDALGRTFADMTAYLQEAAGAATRVVEGDLTVQIKPRTDQDALGQAFSGMVAYLNETAGAATRVAEGDLTVSVRARSERDGLGRAFAEMIAYLQEMADAATRVAAGDLTVSIRPRSEHDILGRAFSEMVATLRDLIGQLSASAATISAAAAVLSETSREINAGAVTINASLQEAAQASELSARGADEVARGTVNQAQAMSEGARQAERLESASHSVAQDAMTASQAAAEAAGVAESGARTITQAVQGMGRVHHAVSQSAQAISSLDQASRQIGGIVATIEQIADQTNLLALNAAIEAARAGDAGRGFAVVADEVRKLAERSSGATREIGVLIQEVQGRTSQVVSSMDAGTRETNSNAVLAEQAGVALAQIQTEVRKVTERVTEISAAAQEMTAASHDVARIVGDVASIVEQSSAAAGEMSASTEQVSSSVRMVAGTTERQRAAVASLVDSSIELAAVAEQLEQTVSKFSVPSAPVLELHDEAPSLPLAA